MQPGGSGTSPPPLMAQVSGVSQPFSSVMDQPGFPDSPGRASPGSDTSGLDVPSPYTPDAPLLSPNQGRERSSNVSNSRRVSTILLGR
jgi:hypothetical protein